MLLKGSHSKIKIRSFELNPASPKEPEPIANVFMRKLGGDPSVVLQAEKGIQAIAHRAGLEFDLDRLNANTFDLHRVIHFAEQSGRGLEFFSRIQDRFSGSQYS